MNTDFSVPMRQSPVAILLLIYKYFFNIIRQVWPALIAIFIGQRSSSIRDILFVSIVAVAVFALIFAIASFFRFTFSIKGDELFIEKGVFKRSKMNIPFQRIQTLNFEQSIIHQLFEVVKIEVDTAGSSKEEFSFNAIDRKQAEALRTLILSKKQNDEIEIDANEVEIEAHEMFSLNFAELIQIGLTQNHLRTLFLIIAFNLAGFGDLADAGLDLDWLNQESAQSLLSSGIVVIAGLAVIILLIVILITIVITLLRYYDFSMVRTGNGFKIQSGLLNRKEYSALDHKIQQIKWTNNPLKRLIGIHDLQMKQASSVMVNDKKSIRVPGLNNETIQNIIGYLFHTDFKLSDSNSVDISKWYLYRNLFYLAFVPWISLSVLGYLLTSKVEAFYLLLLCVYFTIATLVNYRKWRYSVTDEMIYTHHGVFENKHNLVLIYKVQNVEIIQSPFQWRRNLASIRLHTAAGRLLIPYISYEKAKQLKDYILYKVEKNKIVWY